MKICLLVLKFCDASNTLLTFFQIFYVVKFNATIYAGDASGEKSLFEHRKFAKRFCCYQQRQMKRCCF